MKSFDTSFVMDVKDMKPEKGSAFKMIGDAILYSSFLRMIHSFSTMHRPLEFHICFLSSVLVGCVSPNPSRRVLWVSNGDPKSISRQYIHRVMIRLAPKLFSLF